MTAFDYQHIGTALARQSEKFRTEQNVMLKMADPLGIQATVRCDPFGIRAILDGAAGFRPSAEELAEIKHVQVSLRGGARIAAREAKQAVHIDRLRQCTTA